MSLPFPDQTEAPCIDLVVGLDLSFLRPTMAYDKKARLVM